MRVMIMTQIEYKYDAAREKSDIKSSLFVHYSYVKESPPFKMRESIQSTSIQSPSLS